ncbi:MAG: UbiA family prenyltransferase [Vulcanimicrobiota bacterium]
MKKLLFSLAYSNLWLALSAAGQTWVNAHLLGIPPRKLPAILAVMSMYWVYTFAKTVRFDPAADAVNDPERTAFLKRWRLPLIVWGISALVVGSYLAWQRSATTLFIFLLPALAGVLYDVKFLPTGFRYRRLKDITGVKGLVVALAWTILTVGLPICFHCCRPNAGLIWLVGFWNFANWFVNTTYFDLGDLAGDRAEGTVTIPVRFGYAATRRGLHCLNLLAWLVLSGGVWAGWLPWLAHFPGLIVLVNYYILSRARSEEADISFECDIISDGVYIWAAALLALSEIFLGSVLV